MYSIINMMKNAFIFVFMNLISFYFNQAHADKMCKNNECDIPVTFTGKYLEETCEIDINGKGNDETVVLPVLSVSSLSSNGSEAGSRPFAITLKHCPHDQTIALFFKSGLSSTDNATGNLINSVGSNYAKNVQVRLRKEDGSLINVDTLSTMQRYNIPASGEDVRHNYMASYYAKGDQAVTAGEVQAQAAIDLVYE
ncbi:fimbrial protein [Pantoea sp.]|uniref:fimbrial protein n=1 Tax=Pantoea sp. TaxID=69393 RepID=UPI0028A1CD7F|nr:fimbrial protein [Pantoea sp.]